MDPWKEYAAYAECRDEVRRWAELEGKSPQMVEDLARDCTRKFTQSIVNEKSFAVAFAVRFAAWFAETWWYFTRR